MRLRSDDPARELMAELDPGVLMLMGGRPGHGKTVLGLQLAVEAARTGRDSYFFTLEETDADMAERLESLDLARDGQDRDLTIDCDESIDSGFILDRVQDAGKAPFVVVDFLQRLDQQTGNASLGEQLQDLQHLAANSGASIVVLSQIDESFDAGGKEMPTTADVSRLDRRELVAFTKTCFLHGGYVEVEVNR